MGEHLGGQPVSVADRCSPTYAQKLDRYDDEVYNDVYNYRKEVRPIFKSAAQKAIEKEKELMMGDALPEDESDVFRVRKKKDDDYIGRYKVAGGSSEKKKMKESHSRKKRNKK